MFWRFHGVTDGFKSALGGFKWFSSGAPRSVLGCLVAFQEMSESKTFQRISREFSFHGVSGGVSRGFSRVLGAFQGVSEDKAAF